MGRGRLGSYWALLAPIHRQHHSMPSIPTAGSRDSLPLIIQGGMGVGVSNWRLARAVSTTGQLGVVSGTAIDTVIVRRLQDGDIGGDVRRAIAHCPIPGVGESMVRRYFLADGRPPR